MGYVEIFIDKMLHAIIKVIGIDILKRGGLNMKKKLAHINAAIKQ
jgi:hypothetical protein